MTPSVCGSCGFMTGDSDAKFCPECGRLLSEQTAPKKEKIDHDVLTNCPSCGEPVLNRKSKYCLNCGMALDGSGPAPGAAYTPPPAAESFVDQGYAPPPVQTRVPIDKAYKKTCVKLLHIPIGVLMEGGSEVNGEVILTPDGLMFFTKKIQSFLIPFAAIASVNQGYKKNILDMHLVDGAFIQFRMMNAFDWVYKIQAQLNR